MIQNNVRPKTGLILFDLKQGNLEGMSDQKYGKVIWIKTISDQRQGSLIFFDQIRETTKNRETCRAYQTKNRETQFGPKQFWTKNSEAWSCLTKNEESTKNRETFRTYQTKKRIACQLQIQVPTANPKEAKNWLDPLINTKSRTALADKEKWCLQPENLLKD